MKLSSITYTNPHHQAIPDARKRQDQPGHLFSGEGRFFSSAAEPNAQFSLHNKSLKSWLSHGLPSIPRKIELHQGDITQLDFPVDLLAVSAYKNSYVPTPGTVMASLYKRGIPVADFALMPQEDFRSNFGAWLSTDTRVEGIGHLVCLEVIGRVSYFKRALQNLFNFLHTLEVYGYQFGSIAIPMLGTGRQGYHQDEVIPDLLNQSLKFLKKSESLTEIYFVVFNEKDAAKFEQQFEICLGSGRYQDLKNHHDIAMIPEEMAWLTDSI